MSDLAAFASYIASVDSRSPSAAYCPSCGWNPIGPTGEFLATDDPDFQRVLSGERGLLSCYYCSADLRVVPDGLVLDGER